MKLEPKPTPKGVKFSKNDLNDYLQSVFKSHIPGTEAFAVIDLNAYDVNRDEVIQEMLNAGYEFEVIDNRIHLEIK